MQEPSFLLQQIPIKLVKLTPCLHHLLDIEQTAFLQLLPIDWIKDSLHCPCTVSMIASLYLGQLTLSLCRLQDSLHSPPHLVRSSLSSSCTVSRTAYLSLYCIQANLTSLCNVSRTAYIFSTLYLPFCIPGQFTLSL
jgi:hypothetical protein